MLSRLDVDQPYTVIYRWLHVSNPSTEVHMHVPSAKVAQLEREPHHLMALERNSLYLRGRVRAVMGLERRRRGFLG